MKLFKIIILLFQNSNFLQHFYMKLLSCKTTICVFHPFVLKSQFLCYKKVCFYKNHESVPNQTGSYVEISSEKLRLCINKVTALKVSGCRPCRLRCRKDAYWRTKACPLGVLCPAGVLHEMQPSTSLHVSGVCRPTLSSKKKQKKN